MSFHPQRRSNRLLRPPQRKDITWLRLELHPQRLWVFFNRSILFTSHSKHLAAVWTIRSPARLSRRNTLLSASRAHAFSGQGSFRCKPSSKVLNVTGRGYSTRESQPKDRATTSLSEGSSRHYPFSRPSAAPPQDESTFEFVSEDEKRLTKVL
jgi:hypothetical protein